MLLLLSRQQSHARALLNMQRSCTLLPHPACPAQQGKEGKSIPASAFTVGEQIAVISNQALSDHTKDTCNPLQLGSCKILSASSTLAFLTVL